MSAEKKSTVVDIAALTPPEEADLRDQETVIEKGLRSFAEVGQALSKIRDQRLYRASFRTFEAYCRERWQIGKSHRCRLMDAAAVVAVLSPIGDTAQPTAESQVRPLTALETPEEQDQAWRQAVAGASGRVPTAAMVQEAVDKILPPRPRQDAPAEKWDSPAVQKFAEWLGEEYPEPEHQKPILREIRAWINAKLSEATSDGK